MSHRMALKEDNFAKAVVGAHPRIEWIGLRVLTTLVQGGVGSYALLLSWRAFFFAENQSFRMALSPIL